MNANTITASNGPAMKYHCIVVLAEKNKKILSLYRSSKHERPEARQVHSLLNSIEKDFKGYSCQVLQFSLL